MPFYDLKTTFETHKQQKNWVSRSRRDLLAENTLVVFYGMYCLNAWGVNLAHFCDKAKNDQVNTSPSMSCVLVEDLDQHK